MTNVLIANYSLYELFAYFFIYAFFGWIAEVGFHAITRGEFVNRGFLNGPVCPIYGFGVTAILLILGDLINTPWVVLLVGIAVPTVIELITGWILDKFFHNKWWDYSNCKFNFKGYICLSFSILWGLAAVCVICVLHPAVRWLTALLRDPWATERVGGLSALFVADSIVTLLQLLKLNRKLKELDEVTRVMRLGSDAIGKKVADVTLAVEDKALKAKERLDAHHEKVIDDIVAKMPVRLLNAFPTLKSRYNPDAVNIARESIKRRSKRKISNNHNVAAAEYQPEETPVNSMELSEDVNCGESSNADENAVR